MKFAHSQPGGGIAMSSEEKHVSLKENVIGLLMILLVITAIAVVCGLITLGICVVSIMYGLSDKEALGTALICFPLHFVPIVHVVPKILEYFSRRKQNELNA